MSIHAFEGFAARFAAEVREMLRREPAVKLIDYDSVDDDPRHARVRRNLPTRRAAMAQPACRCAV
jgi:O-acetylhomoserine/O-acetylserine sulfhydrylase-like pyridoxal-dependent enzyme